MYGRTVVMRALRAYRSQPLSKDEGLRWLYLACHAAMDVWDDESWALLSSRYLELAREAGALSRLPIALSTRTGLDLYAGRLSDAASRIEEEDAVKEATGVRLARYSALCLAAMRGSDAEAYELMAETRQDVMRRGEGLGIALVHWTNAILHNSYGRYADALSAAEQACEYPRSSSSPSGDCPS